MTVTPLGTSQISSDMFISVHFCNVTLMIVDEKNIMLHYLFRLMYASPICIRGQVLKLLKPEHYREAIFDAVQCL